MFVNDVIRAKGSNEVFAMSADSTVAEMVHEACQRNIGAVLVRDSDGKLAGIVSERDVMRECNRGTQLDAAQLQDIMTRDLASVSLNDDVTRAMDLMISMKIRHLPVLSTEKIEGVITVRDVIEAMRSADKSEMERFVEYLQDQVDTMYQ